ncbi:MAG TPA: transposase [Desulfobacteraceae bacterium]|nr:transposase [Desulfobacteraceae bacterium]
MPRKARIDAPGALHHIMARGIEKNDIFYDDFDRDVFVDRLGAVISETKTACFAWALMPNHIHMLIRTGHTTISTVMQRLLTGYSIGFNRRHKRHGHVFHNRFKSILCQEEIYLLELVRYIHLNPLRAELVIDYKALETYAYTGHRVIMGKYRSDWQDTGYVLGLFGKKPAMARHRYEAFVRKGIAEGRKPELVGGGLVRSLGGWTRAGELRDKGNRSKGDERILGDGDFVENILSQCQERMEQKYLYLNKGYDFEWLVGKVATTLGINKEEITRGGRYSRRVEARSVLCYWASRELGMSTITLSKHLGISQPTVSQSIRRGERIVLEKKLRLVE